VWRPQKGAAAGIKALVYSYRPLCNLCLVCLCLCMSYPELPSCPAPVIHQRSLRTRSMLVQDRRWALRQWGLTLLRVEPPACTHSLVCEIPTQTLSKQSYRAPSTITQEFKLFSTSLTCFPPCHTPHLHKNIQSKDSICIRPDASSSSRRYCHTTYLGS